MATLTEKLRNSLDKYYLNPSSIVQVSLNLLEDALQGKDIVDPSNPFVYLLESSATIAASAISKGESYTRQLYPELCTTKQELYNHLGDNEYIGLFAMPSKCKLTLCIPIRDIVMHAVNIYTNLNVKTVVIPIDSIFTVEEITLKLPYPVLINIMPDESIIVEYNVEVVNPLLQNINNPIEYSVIYIEGNRHIQFDVEVVQLNSQSTNFTLTSLSLFTQNILFTNQFCYAKVYLAINKQWVEINTTFSEKVYDLKAVTAKLQVADNVLKVELPEIYATSNLNSTSIRVDVYTTKGFLDMDLSNIDISSYSAKWLNYDTLSKTNTTKSRRTNISIINKIDNLLIWSIDRLYGGRNEVSLDELRQRVIYRFNHVVTPMRLSDIKIMLSSYGYTTEKVIDVITDKQFIASKFLPPKDNNGVISYPKCLTTDITFNTKNTDDTYSKTYTVHGSGRITILNTAVYKTGLDTVTTFLTDAEINYYDVLRLSNIKQLCSRINNTSLHYSPFYYIVDTSQNTLTVKTFDFIQPKVLNKTLEAFNSIINYNIITSRVALASNGKVYTIELEAVIPDGLEGINSQLTYVDAAGSINYINGTQKKLNTKSVIFTFDIITDFDVNSKNKLNIVNFQNDNGSHVFVDLITKFNIFYLVDGDNSIAKTLFDDLFIINKPVRAATYETVTIQFGEELVGLYSPISDIETTPLYKTHKTDTVARYTDDVYVQNAYGKQMTIGTDGHIIFTKIHTAGDIIYNANNELVYQHVTGDYILNESGLKIIDATSLSIKSFTLGLFMFDLQMKFINTVDGVNYIDKVISILKIYLTKEIGYVQRLLTERNSLFYIPPHTPKRITVSLPNGQHKSIFGELTVIIDCYLNPINYTNPTIIHQITTSIRTCIYKHITSNLLSTAVMYNEIMTLIGGSVESINIVKFLPNGYPILKLVNPINNFAIKQNLTVLPNTELDITDAIVINIKKI